MTICAGTFLGFKREYAVRYSFLMSIPAILGANILDLADAAKSGAIDMGQMPVYLVGIVTAAVSGYFSIRMIRMIAERGKFGWFAYYCWGAGILTLILTILH